MGDTEAQFYFLRDSNLGVVRSFAGILNMTQTQETSPLLQYISL